MNIGCKRPVGSGGVQQSATLDARFGAIGSEWQKTSIRSKSVSVVDDGAACEANASEPNTSRNPQALAGLRDRRSKHTEKTIARALEENWREEHPWVAARDDLRDFFAVKSAAAARGVIVAAD